MTQTTYKYSISGDTLNSKLASDCLSQEIRGSSILTALERIDSSGDQLDIVFKAALSGADEAVLDGLVAAHEGIEIQTPSEVKIVEEYVRTGGRFQCRNVVLDITSSGVVTKDVSFAIPINLLSAEFVIEEEHLGDSIECAGGPYTVIGTLSESVSSSGTELSIATPVFDKIEAGFYLGYTADMVNFTELGVITALDSANSTVTIHEELPVTLPSGTPIYIEAKFVVDFELHNKARHTIGDTKVGASYLEAGKALQFRYNNKSGITGKKFSVMLEYLY